ncbi:MAG: amino acid deaminase/aldolase [Marmoricola sp.]
MSRSGSRVDPQRMAAIDQATAHLTPTFGVVDHDALLSNAADLVRRAQGKPIRLASKSLRSRQVMREILAMPGYRGVLAYTLAEALWLAGGDHPISGDIVVGYPTTDITALARLASDDTLAQRVTVMVDSTDHLRFIAAHLPPHATPIRVCLDLDASLRLAGGHIHLGARRSPVHAPAEAAALARAVTADPRFVLVGLMAYEGQIAGVGDNGEGVRRYAVRQVQSMSAHDLSERRAAAVAAVRDIAPLEFVNGGGTGSIEITVAENAVTEVAAGSGLFAPHIFDHYTRFHPSPAAFFAVSVVRRPSPKFATVLGGGWVASGAVGPDRLPQPVWPPNLMLTTAEGAGEVQTPLTGKGAKNLKIGDRVWFRHAKAGELCEHLDQLHLVSGNAISVTVPTYRGEGKTFL